MNIFNFEAEKINGEVVPFSRYCGQVILLVNTASKCGFTPQLQQLEELHQKYKASGLEILAFPCNQFGAQEPLENGQIEDFCRLNYGVTFTVFAKTEVNGENAHPIFKYAKDALPGLLGNSIKWNFTKFLFKRDGSGFHRYAPTTTPMSIESDINKLLEEKLNYGGQK